MKHGKTRGPCFDAPMTLVSRVNAGKPYVLDLLGEAVSLPGEK
jgi:hypothetical protein